MAGVRRVAATAVIAVAVMVLLTGCGMYRSWVADDSEGPWPTVLATYANGSATMDLTQAGATMELSLDRLGPGAQLVSMMGSSASWRNDAGWSLLLNAFDPGAYGGFGGEATGDVTIQRIVGNEFWVAGGYSQVNRCIVDIDDLSGTSLRGTATCLGLRWVDGIAGPAAGFGEPVYIEGQEPFDATLTFEARP